MRESSRRISVLKVSMIIFMCLIFWSRAEAWDAEFCLQFDHPNCPAPAIFQGAITACEVQKRILNCQDLVDQKILPSEKMKACSARELCEEKANSYDQSGCLKSFKGVALQWWELISFVVGGTVRSAEDLSLQLKQFEDQSSDSYKLCDQSLSCKKLWYLAANEKSEISESDLRKVSLRDLIQNFQFQKGRLDWIKKASSRPIELSTAQGQSVLAWSLELIGKAGLRGRELGCLSPSAELELRCHFAAEALGLVAPGAAVKAPTWAGRLINRIRGVATERRGSSALGALPEGSTIRGAAKDQRSLLVERLETALIHTDQENQRFLRLIQRLPAEGTDEQIFVALELRMKELNKSFPDKSLATTLASRAKEIFHEEMGIFEPLYGGPTNAGYESYKTLEAGVPVPARALSPDQIPRQTVVVDELNQVAKRTLRRFREDPQLKGLFRDGDLERDWFNVGYGRTADQATASARRGRGPSELGGDSAAFDFYSKEVQLARAKNFAEFKTLHQRLTQKFYNTPLMRVEGPGNVTLRASFIDRVRKLSDNSALRRRTLLVEHVQLSELDIEQIRRYLDLVNDFSLNPRPPMRKVVTFKEAEFGGATTDREGMGSRNLAATAKALSESKDHLTALQNIRREEQALTADFVKENEDILAIGQKNLGGSGQIRSMGSGDDLGFFDPSREFSLADKRSYIRSLAQSGQASRSRVAFFPGRVQEEYRSLIATRGEEIAALFRLRLGQTSLSAQKLDGLTIGIDMAGRSPGLGPVNLLIGKSPSLELNWVDRTNIKTAIRQTIKDYNRLLESKDLIGGYHLGDVDILP